MTKSNNTKWTCLDNPLLAYGGFFLSDLVA